MKKILMLAAIVGCFGLCSCEKELLPEPVKSNGDEPLPKKNGGQWDLMQGTGDAPLPKKNGGQWDLMQGTGDAPLPKKNGGSWE